MLAPPSSRLVSVYAAFFHTANSTAIPVDDAALVHWTRGVTVLKRILIWASIVTLRNQSFSSSSPKRCARLVCTGSCSTSLRHLLADGAKGEAWLYPSAC